MELKTIIKFSAIHLFILMFVLFLRFNYIENGDMNVVIFETFLYLPYLLFLTLFNSTLLTLSLHYFKIGLLKWTTAILTPLALTIWFLSSNGQLEIHFWKVKNNEFITLNLILILINLTTILFLTKHRSKKTN